jgi:bud site selection protein 31
MPKIKTKKTVYPEGWDIVEKSLGEFQREMREAENEPTEGKAKNEVTWPLTMYDTRQYSTIRINHKRTRYIYEMYFKRKEISKELYDFLIKDGYADASLIAKWKKQGYEKLCCVSCITQGDHNFKTTCVCRVPKSQTSQKLVQCKTCGCKGCCSGD